MKRKTFTSYWCIKDWVWKPVGCHINPFLLSRLLRQLIVRHLHSHCVHQFIMLTFFLLSLSLVSAACVSMREQMIRPFRRQIDAYERTRLLLRNTGQQDTQKNRNTGIDKCLRCVSYTFFLARLLASPCEPWSYWMCRMRKREGKISNTSTQMFVNYLVSLT